MDEETAARVILEASKTYDKSAPEKTPSLGQLLGSDQAALAYAKKWKLVREDGTVKCLHDWCKGDATLPTLECRGCLARRREQR